MDENYIDNLAGSSEVDEGLWNRLKSRASSFGQGAKNLSGGKFGSVGTIESAKFNSLFKGFVNNELSIIKAYDKAITPWIQHFTEAEKQQNAQIETLEQALKVIDLGKLPVTEAIPSFSNLGARMSGGVSNIMNSYKKSIIAAYEAFRNDVRKLNIVPEQYIERKIATGNSGAYEALKALEPIVGRNITGGIPAGIPSRPPVMPPVAADSTTTAKAPSTPEVTPPELVPTPKPSAPVSPVAPVSTAPIPKAVEKPASSPVASVTPEAPKPTSSNLKDLTPASVSTGGWKTVAAGNGNVKLTEPSGESTVLSKDQISGVLAGEFDALTPEDIIGIKTALTNIGYFKNNPAATGSTVVGSEKATQDAESKKFILAKKAIDNIIANISNTLKESVDSEVSTKDQADDMELSMPQRITKYSKRLASKAAYPFPRTPRISITNSDGSETIWHLRWRIYKENSGHIIEYFETKVLRGKEMNRSPYDPLFKFNAFDVIDPKGGINKRFNAMANLKLANVELGKSIEADEKVLNQKLITPELNTKLTGAFREICNAATSEEEDRGKRQLKDPELTPDKEIPGRTSDEPSGPQVGRGSQAGSNIDPPEQARKGYISPVSKVALPKAKSISKPTPKPKSKSKSISKPATAPVSTDKSKKALTGDDLKNYLKLKQKQELDERHQNYREFFSL